MGLDMGIYKVKLFDGYNYKQLSGMRDQANFLFDYEETVKVLKNFEKTYDEREYWGSFTETQEEKKARIYESMKHYVQTNRGRYNQLKNKFDKEFKERLFAMDEATTEIAYWRKANSIHKWFVDNVQNGIDNCKDYEVSKEQLQTLYDICLKIITDIQDLLSKTKYYPVLSLRDLFENDDFNIKEIEGYNQLDFSALPTQGGFFFGSTEYDNYYLIDIVDTINLLKPILSEENDENIAYLYSSSW